MKMLPVLPTTNTNTNTSRHLQSENINIQNSPSGSTTPKRVSSMIFRIEHLLPQTSIAPPISNSSAIASVSVSSSTTTFQQPSTAGVSAASISTSSNNGMRRTKSNRVPGVYLKQFAPKDTVSEPISTAALMSAPGYTTPSTEHTEHQRVQHTSRTYCSIMHNMLRLTPTVLRRVKLSEDIHSYNALFEIYNGDVRIRIVRDVSRDEELVAWFDEEVTLLMSIPFLTPMNIQGNNRYTCHICQLSFETPNPLKIHLALACGRHTLDILWIRLHYTLKSTAISQHSLSLRLVNHLPPISTARCSPMLQMTTSSTTIPTVSPVFSTDNYRLSAFKPISSSSAQICSSVSASSSTILPISTSTISVPMTSHCTTASIPFLSSITTSAGMSPMNTLHPPNSNPLNAAAQIEAIVSNMGASKQGHLCIYCGKVYSRKYGLKIHIRTHTGFKPLKCKFCLRPFGDPSNLNKHVRLHLQSNAVNSSGENTEGYKCHMCHKTLARRRDLQRHIESRHNTPS